jgi:hypothetical protein
MKRSNLIFVAIVFIVCLSWGASMAAENSDESKMVKEIAFGVMENGPNEAAIEKEYLVNHGPQITAMSGTWMYRYHLWLPYEPPAEAVKNFGAVRGRYAELWYNSKEKYKTRPGSSGGTPGGQQAGGAPVGQQAGSAGGDQKAMPGPDGKKGKGPVPWEETRAEKRVVAVVTGTPTETYLDKVTEWDKATAIRWMTAIKYPDSVSVENGEKWFLNVHAKEAMKQPGLIKFVSYRIIDELTNAGPGEKKKWVRINEYWYESFAAWRKAVIDSPPKYTAPSWGGKYPFVEMESTFIPYVHYVDFLHQKNGYEVTEK